MVLYGVERLRRIVMHISYKKLWKLLIDRELMKKTYAKWQELVLLLWLSLKE